MSGGIGLISEWRSGTANLTEGGKLIPEIGVTTPGTNQTAAQLAPLVEQLADAPPSMPPQVHDQGLLPDTALGIPALHKFVGGEERLCPLSEPHAPFMTTAQGDKDAQLPCVLTKAD